MERLAGTPQKVHIHPKRVNYWHVLVDPSVVEGNTDDEKRHSVWNYLTDWLDHTFGQVTEKGDSAADLPTWWKDGESGEVYDADAKPGFKHLENELLGEGVDGSVTEELLSRGFLPWTVEFSPAPGNVATRAPWPTQEKAYLISAHAEEHGVLSETPWGVSDAEAEELQKTWLEDAPRVPLLDSNRWLIVTNDQTEDPNQSVDEFLQGYFDNATEARKGTFLHDVDWTTAPPGGYGGKDAVFRIERAWVQENPPEDVNTLAMAPGRPKGVEPLGGFKRNTRWIMIAFNVEGRRREELPWPSFTDVAGFPMHTTPWAPNGKWVLWQAYEPNAEFAAVKLLGVKGAGRVIFNYVLDKNVRQPFETALTASNSVIKGGAEALAKGAKGAATDTLTTILKYTAVGTLGLGAGWLAIKLFRGK